jgi:KUP system potassium uptake protein
MSSGGQARAAVATAVSATGIVYGDIGTSPLYAFDLSLKATGSHSATAILGVVSLIFWALAISVTVKYIIVMMRADNDGEGGILALVALAQRRMTGGSPWAHVTVTLGLLGTALFLCDGMITPAVSVLSAVEGLEVVDPDFRRAVIPVTLIVLAALFAFQRRGPARVGRLFGPIMVVWFIVIAVTGALAIANEPSILAGIDPRYGIILLVRSPGLALGIIGAVFLALTGGEALYADMGHFGKEPVRLAWFALVWPSLLLNYFGQGALMLAAAGKDVPQPLYALVAPAAVPFMLALATAATVIASQAVISGAFSIARQAVQLDMLPRIRVMQTSALEQGQIYVPAVNALLFVAVTAFVLGFGSSDALAGAYGAAVIGTMFITTLLGAFVAATQWGWAKWRIGLLFGLLLFMDSIYLAGNLTKVEAGGWVPLTLAAVLFGVFSTWRSGRVDLRAALASMAVPLNKLGSLLENVHRVVGTGVFLASHPDFVPSALIRNLEHNKVAHERILILNIEIMRSPRQSQTDRTRINELLPGVYALTARFGFMETPDVREALRACRARGLRVHLEDCSFFVGQHLVLARPLPGWQGLKRRLFARMQRRSSHAAEFFRMPVRDVIVLNTSVEI